VAAKQCYETETEMELKRKI